MRKANLPKNGCRGGADHFRTLHAVCLLVAAMAVMPPVAAQAQGGQGLEARNGPIQVGEGTVVDGPVSSRNGAIAIGSRSEVGQVSSRNGRISIGPRASVLGGVSTRNGRVTLERGVSVAGDVESRGGRIALAADVRIEGSVDSRNGSVGVGPATRVAGDVRTRNGAVTLETGSWVGGDVATRNGTVRLEDARVGRNVELRAGDLHLQGASRVDGDVMLLMPDEGWLGRLPFFRSGTRRPIVRIDAGAHIGGRLVVDERVRLEIAPGADVPEPEFFSSREEWNRRGGGRD